MMEIKTKTKEKAGLIEVSGELDIATIKDFEVEVERLWGLVDIIDIDFAGVEFIDSTGLQALVYSIMKTKGKNIGIKIFNISREIYDVLEILGIPELLGKDILTTDH